MGSRVAGNSTDSVKLIIKIYPLTDIRVIKNTTILDTKNKYGWLKWFQMIQL